MYCDLRAIATLSHYTGFGMNNGYITRYTLVNWRKAKRLYPQTWKLMPTLNSRSR